jgi:hypothetical protein
MTGKRRVMITVVVASLGAAAYAVWPSAPALEWYTTPPVLVGGRNVRCRALVPAGWVVAGDNGVTNQSGLFASMIHQRPIASLASPAANATRDISVLQRLKTLLGLARRTESDGAIAIGLNPSITAERDTSRMMAELGGAGTVTRIDAAFRSVKGGVSIMYSCTDRNEFEASYRPICESFQVISQP